MGAPREQPADDAVGVEQAAAREEALAQAVEREEGVVHRGAHEQAEAALQVWAARRGREAARHDKVDGEVHRVVAPRADAGVRLLEDDAAAQELVAVVAGPHEGALGGGPQRAQDVAVGGAVVADHGDQRVLGDPGPAVGVRGQQPEAAEAARAVRLF